MSKNKHKVDWFFVISRLQRAGLDHGQQAKEVGVCRRTIGYWASGLNTEPPYSKGMKLLDVFRTVVGSTDYDK